MDILYPGVKHFHMLTILLSVSLLTVRFFWSMTGSGMLQRKWVKITPHAVDTLLLLSGASLCFLIQQFPGSSPWLTEKLLSLVAYILLGVFAMKSQGKLLKVLAFLGALGWLGMIAKVAMSKTPILMS
ncbi:MULTISPECIES: SirB2 family protein [Ferrimonas]|uniref:SirB2 family protein n=1 Tax=Ferrimonas TaxID=44011 RepID=UPI000413B57C|nr:MULTISPECIES: SirB2 family protein [Ferrimonas]USD38262.1 SirB2 family protein [Ferrimonas sp. SCSIO 43195]